MSRLLSAIAIRHVGFEDLGLFLPALKALGWAVSYRDAPNHDLSGHVLHDADLLVVLGGPMEVYDAADYPYLEDEIRLLERRLAAGKPTLGICLGAQLMATALGARVWRAPHKEIGWGRVMLTDDGRKSPLLPLDDPESLVLHWHGDTFDLPVGAVHLARNENYEHQAFSYGAQSLALQFHIEAAPEKLEQWYVGHAAELSHAGISAAALREQSKAAAIVVRRQAHEVFGRWLASLRLEKS